MTEQEGGAVFVETFRNAAKAETGGYNYSGLTIHAIPGIHERIGELADGCLAPGAAILDLASGSGAMCQRLKDLGFRPTGCDIVTENFRLHGQVAFSSLNLNLALPDDLVEAFDAVTATELIEHLENPRHLLRQCFRALRPGGVLLLSTPNVDSPLSKATYVRNGDLRWFSEHHYRFDGHITPLPRRVLERALTEAGFIDVQTESVVPLTGASIGGWKLRLLVWLVTTLSMEKPLTGDILIVRARRPALDGQEA